MRRYQIHAAGQLGRQWEAYFHPFTLTNLDDGTLLIEGNAVDQSALFGVLSQLFQINLLLIAVTLVSDQSDSSQPFEAS